MKKVLFGLVLSAMLSVSASAAALTFSNSFSGNAIILPSTVGSTEVSFSVFTPTVPLCNIGCTGVTFDTGLLLTSGVTETFTFTTAGTPVVFSTTDPWSVQLGPNNTRVVNLVGTYTQGANSSVGTLTFTYQGTGVVQQLNINEQVQNLEVTTFSASGTTVPEPGSMALLGSGLVGLGVLARRRRK